MDYKELIRLSKKAADGWRNDHTFYQAGILIDSLREATETLLEERDAAIADLTALGQDSGDSCHLCKHLPCVDKNGNGHCLGFVWRGPQKGGG